MPAALRAVAAGALLALAATVPATAQNTFPTAGGATVPGFVTMCISGNVATPCNPSAPGTIYSAAGTPVPTCNAATNGFTVVASDITTATYRASYVSGGTNLGRLFCVSGTGWLVD
jgi:hypothetical protein